MPNRIKYLCVLLLAFVLAHQQVAYAAPGVWSAVASMNAPRENHTLTLLPNGQILAVGGVDFSASTHSSAELYNPTTNIWSLTTSMSTVRQGHSATLLADGRVLVVGGLNNALGSERTSAEIYDPSTGVWSNTGSMAQARQGHHAVRLLDGRVLIIGGTANGSVLATAEIYTPGTGLWSAAAPLATAKGNFASTLLPDGRVLVVGGFFGGSEVNTYQIYTPASNTWSTEANMNDLRSLPTATVLANGQVLVAGGDNAFPTTNKKTELYNPGTNSWSYTTGDLAIVRSGHTAHLLPNGQVLVAGGYSGSATMTAELYTATSGLWSGTGSLVGNRSNHETVQLADGRILASGGFNISTFNSLATAEIYEPTQLNSHCGIGTGVQTFNVEGETLQVNISTLGTINCLTATQVRTTHPNATSNMQTGKYWQINATNSGGSPATGYTLSLVLPNPFGTATGVKACRYPGGLGGSGWDCTAAQSATSSQVTVTGVTQLSDWAVGQDVGPTAVQLAAQETAVSNFAGVAIAAMALLIAGSAWVWRGRGLR